MNAPAVVAPKCTAASMFGDESCSYFFFTTIFLTLSGLVFDIVLVRHLGYFAGRFVGMGGGGIA